MLKLPAVNATPKELPDQLVESMVEFVKKTNARGLAAPQFGIPLQVIVVRIDNVPHVLLNPNGVTPSGEDTFSEEGCFSIPNFYTQVRRKANVEFNFQTVEGFDRRAKLSGRDARSFLHEYDHLKGILITDLVSRPQRRLAERTVAEYVRGLPK